MGFVGVFLHKIFEPPTQFTGIARTLIGGVYSYIHVLHREFLFKPLLNLV